MRKLSYLMLMLALVIPMALPFGIVTAQDDPTIAALEEYNADLPAGYGNISVTDLSVRTIEEPDLFLLDVRQPEEYAEGHLPGAVNIPLRELGQNLDLLPPMDEQFVVYCGSGFRSSLAMTALQILGYDVLNMAGGIGAWNAEEFPTTTDVFEAEAGEMPAVDETVLADVDAALAGIPDGWGVIKADQLNIELIENPPDLLIDVRKDSEWAEGYIGGATHMQLEMLMSYVDDLPEDMDANIIVYCKAGHRGNMAAMMLRTLGYTNVRNLAGGFLAWANAEYAVEMPTEEAMSDVDPTMVALEAYNADLPAGYGNISVTDLSVRTIEEPDLLLLDVRQPEEYAEGHLPGAVNIPLRELGQNLDLLPPMDEQFVVYCGSGFRSSLAMTALQILGYDVLNMAGGIGAWNAEEFPTTTDVFEAEAGEMPAVDEILLADMAAALAGIPDGWGVIKADQLNIELIENPPDLLIDVRTPGEWDEGYIGGATHMQLEVLMSYVDDLPEDMDANIIVYCKAGHRGNMAAMMLRTLGYTNVRNLAGGFLAWANAEYAVEMPAE